MASKAEAMQRTTQRAAPPKQEKQPQPKQEYDNRDYIEPRGKHPDAAVYVARDKKSGAEVSFDQWGRKLDSNGNVVHGDRQRAGDAGARIAVKPQQQAPEQKQYTDGGYGSKLTNMLSPGRAQQPAVAPQRSSWDNSIIPSAYGPQRGNNPNTLAPGGRDNSFLGMPYPTARNGLVGSQWARPWTGQQQPPPMSPPPQQQSAPSYNPLPQGPSGAEQFMAGNNPYSPVQPKVNIPGFGQLPTSIQMQTGGLAPPAEPWRTPATNMPYPPTGASNGNQYIPDTYSRQTVPVYDPNQLSWGVP